MTVVNINRPTAELLDAFDPTHASLLESPTGLIIPDTLVIRAQDGDVVAQEDTCARTLPLAYRIARNLRVEPTQVEDIAQDGLVRVFEQGIIRRKYHPENNFAGWAAVVVRNAGMTMLKRWNRVPTNPTEPSILTEVFEGEEHTDELESRGLQKEYIATLIRDAHLSRNFAAPFMLHHIDGYEYTEIAAMLGIEVGTVKSRTSRAKTQLAAYCTAHAATV